MHGMSDTAATIFAATVGGVATLAVGYIGYRAGRRQTSDQATVEHGQWLRGQRQQAYLAFVSTWDTTVESLRDLQQVWEQRAHEYEIGSRPEHPAEESIRLLSNGWQAVRREIERVELLGPQRIDLALRALEDAFREVRDVFTAQEQTGAACPYWDEWNRALAQANVARLDFHAAAIRTLRQPPSPEGEGEGLEE
jgi:hypothetical protein